MIFCEWECGGCKRRAVAEWVSDTVNTDIFGTFTFRSNDNGSKPGVQRVRKAVEAFKEASRPYLRAAFIATERGALNDRLHVHMVGESYGDVSRSVMGLRKIWTQGFSRVEPAVGGKGSVFYTTKYVTKDPDADFDMWRHEQIGIHSTVRNDEPDPNGSNRKLSGLEQVVPA